MRKIFLFFFISFSFLFIFASKAEAACTWSKIQYNCIGSCTYGGICRSIAEGVCGGCYSCTPNCSCAASTCVGSTCSNGCGGYCSGTKCCGECPSSCQHVCSTQTCGTVCGQTCYGERCCQNCPSSCGDTCIGTYCGSACGNSCYGTKDCSPPPSCVPDGSCVGSGSCCHLTNFDVSCSNPPLRCGAPCTPNCSCAADTCVGQTCYNGCLGSCAGTKDCSVVGCENGFCSDPTKQSLVIANTFCGSAGGCPAGQRKYDVWCAGSSGPAICSPEGGACLSDSACTNQSCELAEAGNNLCGGCTIPSRCCSPCRRMTGKTFCTDQYYPAGEYEPICGDTDPTCGGECTGGGGEPTPGGSPTPSPSPTPTPQPGAWWQVKDSDVQSTGDLLSNVPGGYYFGILGTGGFPGVPAYSGNTWLTGANVSETGWLVESTVTNAKTYSYDYFANQIPDDVAALETTVDVADVEASLTTGGTPDTNNYYWYKYDGALNGGTALTLPAVSFGTRKVILMVDSADVNITGNISLTVGQGFFMIVVKGNINVDPGVGGSGPNLEGLYFSDGIFSDGVGDTQLWIRGSVVANGGISMQRDLGLAADATTPSELFAYAPDQIMLFPKVLGVRRINWKEIAP